MSSTYLTFLKMLQTILTCCSLNMSCCCPSLSYSASLCWLSGLFLRKINCTNCCFGTISAKIYVVGNNLLLDIKCLFYLKLIFSCPLVYGTMYPKSIELVNTLCGALVMTHNIGMSFKRRLKVFMNIVHSFLTPFTSPIFIFCAILHFFAYCFFSINPLSFCPYSELSSQKKAGTGFLGSRFSKFENSLSLPLSPWHCCPPMRLPTFNLPHPQ